MREERSAICCGNMDCQKIWPRKSWFMGNKMRKTLPRSTTWSRHHHHPSSSEPWYILGLSPAKDATKMVWSCTSNGGRTSNSRRINVWKSSVMETLTGWPQNNMENERRGRRWTDPQVSENEARCLEVVVERYMLRSSPGQAEMESGGPRRCNQWLAHGQPCLC